MPDNLTIPNYDLCIVLGNLLENSIEACIKMEEGREVHLVVKQQGEQLAMMVRNRFGGVTKKDGVLFASTKKDGGLGLRSVKAVADRHNGLLVTEYDGEWFHAYVLL